MKKSKIKTKVQMTLEIKGIENYKSMSLSIPEERYLISIASVLSTVNKMKVDTFFKEFEKIILRKNIPLLKINTVSLLYKRWLNYPDICDLLVNFSKKIGRTALSEEAWEMVIYKTCFTNKDGIELLFNRYFLLARVIQQGLYVQQSPELINVIKTIMSIEMPLDEKKSSRRKTEKRLLIEFEPLFIWSKTLIKMFPSNPEKVNELICKLIQRHFTYAENISRDHSPSFNTFILKVSEVVNYQFIFTYTWSQLYQVYEIYLIKPELFEKEWITVPEYDSENILTIIFSKFKVPPLFIHNYFFLSQKEKNWFSNILKCKSLRHVQGLPIVLTKKANNVFRNMNLNSLVTVEEGLICASMKSIGVSEDYALEVVANIRNYEECEFWVKTMSILYFKELEIELIGEIMDYISHLHFTENKGINWKQKKVPNLVKESSDWHRDWGITKSLRQRKNNRFKSSSFADLKITQMDSEYIVKQIKSSRELYVEGKKLSHCVYSYERNCLNNTCVIFSLRKIITDEPEKPLITIEVRGNSIFQARGKYNRKPSKSEWAIINNWADDEGIKIAC